MRLGVLDVGSNTVHLLLLDGHPGARPEPYASHKIPLQLVQYLTPSGDISDEGRAALTEFVKSARDFAIEICSPSRPLLFVRPVMVPRFCSMCG